MKARQTARHFISGLGEADQYGNTDQGDQQQQAYRGHAGQVNPDGPWV